MEPHTQVRLRPHSFEEFTGQDHIKSILHTALQSSVTSGKPLGHILFSGKSGYGKTTLATICANTTESRIKIITGYAINKASELISLLNLIQKGDVLFIDEIHRLKSHVEEVLYTAMEDYCVDMIMPDGHHIRLPVEPFTLIGATTKLESLSEPLKNRFIYQFHMEPYSFAEKKDIIRRYLGIHKIQTSETNLDTIAHHISSVPRQITNLCLQLHDYMIVHASTPFTLTTDLRDAFWKWTSLEKGGITPLHKRYLALLEKEYPNPVGLKTLSVKLGISEKSIEHDIEPLLFELDRIDKTSRGRVSKKEKNS